MEFWSLLGTVCLYSFLVLAPERSTAGESSPHPRQEELECNLVGDGAVPVPYILGIFPADIQRLLDAGDTALSSNTFYRRKLRKCIAEDLAKYTLYVHNLLI